MPLRWQRADRDGEHQIRLAPRRSDTTSPGIDDCLDAIRSQNRIFVLPYADNHPTQGGQSLVGSAVAPYIRVQLVAPPVPIALWEYRMISACMPETAIDVDCNSTGGEDQICTAAQRGNRGSVDSVP